MNVGLFGGTFNPIHQGHIDVITYVKVSFHIDTVHLIPSAIPPHKTAGTLASAKDRFQMVQQAVLNISGLMVSDVELTREGKSFSIDTISHFRNKMDADGKLYFIMGSDAFFDIGSWKNSAEIFRLTDIIVMRRAGDTRKLEDIELFLKSMISSGYSISQALNGQYANAVVHKELKSVHICNVPEIYISSTQIREKIRKQESIKGLVPPSVESTIIKKRLYS